MAFTRQKQDALKTFLLAYVPLVLITGASYFFHARIFLLSELYETSTQTYLLPFFPGDASQWLHNFYELYEYVFLKPAAAWMILLSAVGLGAILAKKQYALGAAIVMPFLINFGLTLFHKFPFGGGRQSIYLLPMIALLIGTAIQFLFDFAKRVFAEKKPRAFSRLENRSLPLFALGTALLIGLSIQILFTYERTEYLRRYPGTHGASWREFPLKRSTYAQLLSSLEEESASHDIVLTNQLSAYYLLWFESERSQYRTFAVLNEGHFRDRTFYFTSRVRVETKGHLLAVLQELHQHVDVPRNSKILLLNIGWKDGVHDDLLALSAPAGAIRRILSVPGGFLFSLDVHEVTQRLVETYPATFTAKADYEYLLN